MEKYEFKFRSQSARFFPNTVFINSSKIELFDNTHIDDFVFFNGGEKSIVSNNVHIAAFVSIVGGGTLHLDSFSGVSGGCRIITGSDDFSGKFLTNPTVPRKYRNVNKGFIYIGKHALLGSNCVVLPNVRIGDGTVVAAGSIINKDLDSWSIYAGSHPIKKICDINPRDKLILEIDYLKEEYSDNESWVQERIIEIRNFISSL